MKAINIQSVTPKAGKKGEYFVVKGDDGQTYYAFDPAIKGAVGKTIDAEVEEQQGDRGMLCTIREFKVRPPELDQRDKSIVAQVVLKEACATVRTMLEKDLLDAAGIFSQTTTLFDFYNKTIKSALTEEPPMPGDDELEPF